MESTETLSIVVGETFAITASHWTLLLSEVPDQNFRDVKKLMTKR
jgi:hypothetical protein